MLGGARFCRIDLASLKSRFGISTGSPSMNHIAKIAVGSTLCLALLACSETTVMNKMGLGKNPPDETQVVASNNLALPPDLQLRPPAPGTPSEEQVQKAATQTAVSPTPPDAFTAPAVETRSEERR